MRERTDLRDFLVDNVGSILSVIVIIAIISLLAMAIIYDSKHFVTEQSTIIIEVEHKDVHTYTTRQKVGNSYVEEKHHEYFIYFDGNKIEVSKNVYRNTEIGDRMVLDCYTKYSKDTGEIASKKYQYRN